MDVSALHSVAQSPTPQPQADLRPTADAAAIARDPNPEVPLPPSLSQQGVISAGMLRSGGAQRAEDVARVEETSRTLKPFGVTMLPSDEARDAARDAQAARDEAEAAKRDSAKAEQAAVDADRIAAKTSAEPPEQTEEAVAQPPEPPSDVPETSSEDAAA